MKEITIGKPTLRKGKIDKPYLIAEAGVNHEGDIEKAYDGWNRPQAGADAIKFQTAIKPINLHQKFSCLLG